MGKKERVNLRDSRRDKASMEQSSVSQKRQGTQVKCPNLAPKQKEHTEPLWAKEGPSGLAVKDPYGTSLAVQWLRLCTSTAGGMGSNPGRENKIPHASPGGQKK